VNCTLLQRWLLAAEQPTQPSAEVQSHLTQCPTCRAWQHRLVQLEQQITQIPIPPSTAKAALLRRIRGTEADGAPRPAVVEGLTIWRHSSKPGAKERGLRKLSLAFALAAALLVFALAWWAWPHSTVKLPMAVSITPAQRDQKKLEDRLTKALLEAAPHERVLKLADLAEEVHGEARQMVGNTDRLDLWASFYSQVVGEHLLKQARRLPPIEHRAVLDQIALRLQRTESAAFSLATELKLTAPKSAASFDQIALAARKGEKDLRALPRG
jgi:hypothetical protein